MKIQIIHLDSHDDITATCDKLAWAKAPRVLLVWPKHGRILTSRLDLVRLQRLAQSCGSQLGVVTSNPLVVENARLLNISLFTSESSAIRRRWKNAVPSSTHQPHPVPDLRSFQENFRSIDFSDFRSYNLKIQKHRWRRLVAFGLAVFSILLLAGELYPSAVIELYLQTRQQVVSIPVLASSQIKVVNISGNLPAKTFLTEVDGQGDIATSGEVNVPDRYASGMVEFTNLGDQRIEVPAGTIVLISQPSVVRFGTTNTVWVGAGSGQTAQAPIQAIAPGIAGNLGAGVINSVEGALGLELTASNPDPTTGGSEKTVSAVSTDDYQKLRSSLISNLEQSALKQIQTQLDPSDFLVKESIAIKSVLEEDINPTVNQPGDHLSLKLRIECSAFYLTGQDLAALGTANLDASLQKNYHTMPGTLRIEAANDAVIDTNQVIHWDFKASRQIQINVSDDTITDQVQGLAPKKAQQKIEDLFSLPTPPKVVLSPAWWPRLPLSFRIQVSTITRADPGG